jgi:hypothetical protein
MLFSVIYGIRKSAMRQQCASTCELIFAPREATSVRVTENQCNSLFLAFVITNKATATDRQQ